MIYALLSKKCRKSHLRTCTGQIAQDAWIGGWGGQPNLGNACILGAYGPELPPIEPVYSFVYLAKRNTLFPFLKPKAV